MVVFRTAVQDAPTEFPAESVVAPAGVQVAAAPRLLAPLRNCTVPVGPSEELLLDETVAVSVMLPPEATTVVLGTIAVVVVACVMVTVRVLLAAFEV